ncbi:hypothetical protein SNE40_023112 [Patella caerulea]|uniref:Uncharacterized protein n=1 Tax=Patella caerulea TaxID=87958 RepID=A0AAN8G9H6_PATCE
MAAIKYFVVFALFVAVASAAKLDILLNSNENHDAAQERSLEERSQCAKFGGDCGLMSSWCCVGLKCDAPWGGTCMYPF